MLPIPDNGQKRMTTAIQYIKYEVCIARHHRLRFTRIRRILPGMRKEETLCICKMFINISEPMAAFV